MYDSNKIEKKWQKYWEDNNTFVSKIDKDKEKYYILVEFPYPSGNGLHVGHARSYAALDALSRKRRMQGYNVLFPMGWDAFGLPAEQYAIKNKVHPKEAVKRNIEVFKNQIKSLGLSFDWSRELSTTDEDYYKWTQWQFLKFFEHDMAYKGFKEINWCPECKIGLANEEAEGGVCERCGGEVIKKNKEQWILKMSSYAEALLDGLDETEFLDRIKTAQINWIGKSEGALVNFKVDNDYKLKVFTTRPDTLYGVTFMVVSVDHEIIEKYKDNISNYDEIIDYKVKTLKKSDIERTDMTKEKTGVKIKGVEAINPVTNEKIEIWVSDYVLSNYGTGAIMAVPAHDDRDYEFAKKFGINIIEVIEGGDITKSAYTGDGVMVNSDVLNGIDNKKESILKMISYLEENNIGKKEITYKLQDWIFSRQRFWGEPIPIINCEHCGHVPVPYDELPVRLPDVTSYEPTDTGESPLSNIDSWVNVKCPKCGMDAKRETDIMPNWAGSSWYYLRYMDNKNDKEFVNYDVAKYYDMVDYYNGGMEHATRHLLYARFWHKFLYNIGLVPTSEPFKKRVAHGMILGSNGEKMSKSRGNVVNPNEMIELYGADSLRVYEMFIGDYQSDAAWNEKGLKGCRRFLDKIYKLREKVCNDNIVHNEILLHQTIKKVSEDLENMKYNTAISSLMILVNAYEKEDKISHENYTILLTLLHPFAPHITEELNEMIGNDKKLHELSWPIFDVAKTVEDEKEIGVQINGKLRATIKININTTKEEIEASALKEENIIKHIGSSEIKKIIVIPNKIVNIVI